MGLEGGGKSDIAQQDADAGSFQAEATGLLHAGQATEPAQHHDATIKPASPKQVLPKSSNDHTAELKPGMPGLNTDNFHQQTRDLLFQHDTHGVPVAFQPQVDITAVGLPQIHFDNGAQPDNGDNVRPQQLPPEGSERPQPQPEFTNHIVKRGDSLWKIARENLPKGASNRIVANYVHQIEADNPMHDPNLIMPGQIIKVRGYAPSIEHDTTHGAEHNKTPEHYHGNHHEHRLDHGGRTYPYPQDNHSQHDSENQHGGNGNDHQSLLDTTHHKDAPPPKDQPHNDVQPLPQHDKPSNDTQRKPLPPVPEFVPLPSKHESPDLPPKPQPSDKSETPVKPSEKSLDVSYLSNPEVQNEHTKIVEMAKQHNNAREYEQFLHDLNQYEHSFGELEKSYRAKGENNDEIDKEVSGIVVRAYKGVERLYETEAKDPQDRKQLDLAARTAVHNVAEAPANGNIAQGQHNTCGADSVETMLCIKHSDKYINMVADLAITGQYTAADGSVVKIDKTPYGDSQYGILDHHRNYASQLFQVATINLDLQKKDPHLRWVQQRPDPRHFNSSGEVLLKDGKVVDKLPELNAADIDRMYSLVSGEPLKPIMLEYSKSPDAGAICVNSFSEFEKVLQERKDKGELWTIMGVNAASKLLKQPQPGWHAMLLSGYYPNGNGSLAKVRYFNSWGIDSTNKVVYAREMFNALHSSQ